MENSFGRNLCDYCFMIVFKICDRCMPTLSIMLVIKVVNPRINKNVG